MIGTLRNVFRRCGNGHCDVDASLRSCGFQLYLITLLHLKTFLDDLKSARLRVRSSTPHYHVLYW